MLCTYNNIYCSADVCILYMYICVCDHCHACRESKKWCQSCPDRILPQSKLAAEQQKDRDNVVVRKRKRRDRHLSAVNGHATEVLRFRVEAGQILKFMVEQWNMTKTKLRIGRYWKSRRSRAAKIASCWSLSAATANPSNFGCDFFCDPYPKSIHGQG